MHEAKEAILRRISDRPHSIVKRPRLNELLKVYQDLEKLLSRLRESALAAPEEGNKKIDLRKLIDQLSRSKTRIERKISNTLLLETQQWKKKIRSFVSHEDRSEHRHQQA